MKQIVAVLVFTALAAVAFVVVRKLNEAPQQPGTAGQVGSGQPGAGPGQLPPRPAAGDDQAETTTITNAQGQEVEVSPGIAADLAARAGFEWTENANGDLVTPMADRWELDLSGVDLNADVLVRFKGGEVTRDEFRAAVAQRMASPLLESMAAVELGKARARARGVEPRLLSQALRDKRFEIWCEAAGLDEETGQVVLGLRNKMPGPVARRFYDVAADAILATLSGADSTEKLSSDFVANVPQGAPAGALSPLLTSLDEAWAALPADGSLPEDMEAVNKLFLTFEQLALLRLSTSRSELAVRTWTQFDHPLEPGAVIGVATGELPPGMPPWEASEGVVQIPMGDLWELLEANYFEFELLDALKEYAYFEIVSAAQAADGNYGSDSADWALWLAEHEEASRTLLGSRMLNLELLGFPTLGHYRATNRLLRGFERGQDEGWQAEGDMREFYERNRFLVEGWRAELVVALFPAVTPEERYGEPDFERSLAEAEAMRARVEQGEDFEVLAEAHTADLAERYTASRGAEVGRDFANAISGGRLQAPLNELNKFFKQSYFSRLIDGVAVAHNAVAELRDGTVSQPWRTPMGYVLVRADGAFFAMLEKEFEDAEYLTRTYHRDTSFSNWATEAVRGAELEVVVAD